MRNILILVYLVNGEIFNRSYLTLVGKWLFLFLVLSDIRRSVALNIGRMITSHGKAEVAGENVPQYHFAHHIS
jgi:hypothetical protein